MGVSLEPFSQKSHCEESFCVNGAMEVRAGHLLCGFGPRDAADFGFGVNAPFCLSVPRPLC